jgi:membrane dipeptidase
VDHVVLGLDLSEYWAREDFEKFFKMVPELGPSIKFESKYVQDLEDHSKTVNIARGLVSGGYSDQEIGKVLGGNFLRVFGKVWR